jgi:hypothetical protein
LIQPVILDVDNRELCKIPEPKEIKNTIFEMQSLKALRPDGFPPIFYKKTSGT